MTQTPALVGDNASDPTVEPILAAAGGVAAPADSPGTAADPFGAESEARNCERTLGDRRHGLTEPR